MVRKIALWLGLVAASVLVAAPAAAAPTAEAKTLHASYVAQAAADIASYEAQGIPEIKRPTIHVPNLAQTQAELFGRGSQLAEYCFPGEQSQFCGWTGYDNQGLLYTWSLTALNPHAPCKCGVSGADMGGSFNNISSYLNNTSQTLYVYDDETGLCHPNYNEGWRQIPPGGAGSYAVNNAFNNDISGLLDPDYTGHHPGCI